MSLPPGTRFGPYQIQVLPGRLAGDAERLQRFEQEARAAWPCDR